MGKFWKYLSGALSWIVAHWAQLGLVASSVGPALLGARGWFDGMRAEAAIVLVVSSGLAAACLWSLVTRAFVRRRHFLFHGLQYHAVFRPLAAIEGRLVSASVTPECPTHHQPMTYTGVLSNLYEQRGDGRARSRTGLFRTRGWFCDFCGDNFQSVDVDEHDFRDALRACLRHRERPWRAAWRFIPEVEGARRPIIPAQY